MLACLVSCAGHESKNERGFQVLSINPEKADKISWDDMFEDASLVQLETNDTVLINAIYNIIPFDNYLYILDRRSESVFIYTNEGEIRKVIHDQGSGPEEYSKVSCIAVDKWKNELSLIDNNLRKKFIYDTSGDFVRIDTIPFRLNEMLFLDGKNKILLRSVLDIKDGYMMNCYRSGKLVNQYHPYHYMNGASINYWETPLVQSGNYTYMHVMYNDTICRYDFDQLEGGYIVDFGNKAIPSDLKNIPQDVLADQIDTYVKQRDDKVAQSPYLFEDNDDCMWLSYLYNKNNYYCRYDKRVNSLQSFYGPYIGELCMLDILYGTFVQNGKFYFILDQLKYSNLSEDRKNEIKHHFKSLYLILEKSSLEDNPIVLIAKIRDV